MNLQGSGSESPGSSPREREHARSGEASSPEPPDPVRIGPPCPFGIRQSPPRRAGLGSPATGLIPRRVPPMSQSQPTSQATRRPGVLRLFRPLPKVVASDRWRINGHPARLLIWSIEEWESLEDPPTDAQLHPFGVWCQ